MIESGQAFSVMGNHEYNAIAYYTKDFKGNYLRSHSDGNKDQHKYFLEAYYDTPDEWQSVIDWFKTLPLWLELGAINVIHACWGMKLMHKIKERYSNNLMSEELLLNSSTKGTWEFKAIETLLKGKEVPLKEVESFKDAYGKQRHHIRIKW